MPYSFSSVAHVWVPGAKTTGPIAKSNFYISENFQVSMRSIQYNFKKIVHIKGPFMPLPNYAACQKWRILFLDIFQRNLIAHL
jgi:hypothetical protein